MFDENEIQMVTTWQCGRSRCRWYPTNIDTHSYLDTALDSETPLTVFPVEINLKNVNIIQINLDCHLHDDEDPNLKYLQSYKDAKQEEFFMLVQGQMTVVEYQVKFIELSKYAQVLLSNKIDKCRRFENGLRENIRSVVTGAGWNEFRKLVESVLRVEKSISDRPSVREQTMFRASGSQTMIDQRDDSVNRTSANSVAHSNITSGSSTKSKGQAGRLKTQGKVFAMTQQAAEESPDVIMGMLSIFDRNARILIDLGSTHSFISFAFALYVNQKPEILGSCLVVNIPVEKSLLANNIYRDCGIKVKENELKTNLIPLEIHDFNVILSMNFLASNRASVDCFRKDVVFRQSGQPEIIFNGHRKILSSCLVSAIDTRRLLNNGCYVYLTHVIDIDVSKLKLEDIPVVKDFPNVFPEELLG
ncbi:uncharacterized protein LOC111392263 [Olea europaea var. sylvestris]|uniref:uncharacterized protein LOC111392263 n=1 Tax=Olea europaea var. sylvestris TaxID=158386 RepID=UPI000C1D3E28|nr:uncharacterized protein LOC111392263 [Olea europaea var. sylvestris]